MMTSHWPQPPADHIATLSLVWCILGSNLLNRSTLVYLCWVRGGGFGAKGAHMPMFVIGEETLQRHTVSIALWRRSVSRTEPEAEHLLARWDSLWWRPRDLCFFFLREKSWGWRISCYMAPRPKLWKIWSCQSWCSDYYNQSWGSHHSECITALFLLHLVVLFHLVFLLVLHLVLFLVLHLVFLFLHLVLLQVLLFHVFCF